MLNTKKSYLNEVMKNKCQHLTGTQCNESFKFLQNFEVFFFGTLGTWKTDQVDFKLKNDVKPMCSKPYPVLKVHAIFFKRS